MSRSGDNNATSDSEAMSQGLVINILNIVEQVAANTNKGSCCHADGCCPTDVVSEGDKKIDSDSQINTDTFPS